MTDREDQAWIKAAYPDARMVRSHTKPTVWYVFHGIATATSQPLGESKISAADAWAHARSNVEKASNGK